MKNNIGLFLLLGMALFAFTGCITKTSGIYVDKGKLSIENPAFASNIQMIQDSREKTNTGFLIARVTLKNLKHTDYQLQYCLEWLDKNGAMMRHAPTSWCPLSLHGKEVKEINAVSPIQGAEDFRLKLRQID